MITTEITKLQYDIYGLLAERRLKDAFGKLALLVNELQDWVSRDKLNEMETSYRYMIQYMLDGVEDPERKSIYDHLVLSAYVLTDRVSDRLAGQVSPSQYYGWKRYASASRTGISLSSQFDVCDNEINDLSLALLLSEQEQDFSKIQSLKHRIEDTAGNLVMDIWTNYPAAEEDYRSLREALFTDRFPDTFVSLLLSAVFFTQCIEAIPQTLQKRQSLPINIHDDEGTTKRTHLYFGRRMAITVQQNEQLLLVEPVQ